MSTAWAAGGFYSTVQDLTLWNEALAHGKLLNSESTKRMCTVYPETLYQGMHCGYAVVLAERFGHQLQYHGGGISGFQNGSPTLSGRGLGYSRYGKCGVR